MSDAPAAAVPSVAEVQGWGGLELDDVAGRPVGRVEGVYADAEAATAAWLVVSVAGRRRRFFALGRGESKRVVVPVRECAAMAARVWSAQDRDAMRGAPAVDPSRPLLREHEVAICAHYGIGERIGRHAELAGRAADAITAQPA